MLQFEKPAIAVWWCLVGLALGTLLGMWLPPDVLKAPPKCVDGVLWCFLYTWQTLIAGGFALVGAVFLWIQIKDERAAKARELKRSQTKARLRLSHELPKINKYLKGSFEAWKLEDRSQQPTLPDSAIEILIEVAAGASSEQFEMLSNLVEHSQVFDSRSKMDSILYPEISQMLLDILEFWFWNNRLFDYARFLTEAIPTKKPERSDYIEILKHNFDMWQIHQDDPLWSRANSALDSKFTPADLKLVFHNTC